jgi:hypothetical protein
MMVQPSVVPDSNVQAGLVGQAQTLGVPPPPQVCGEMQLLGQVLPHPLEPPHFPAQLGVHPHALAVPPPPQVCGETQLLGHVLPHPSEPPHFPAQLGVHPHTLAVPPPPQVCGETQLLGHVPPHPFEPPHFPVQLGVHPHTLGVPPPPQVSGDAHVPQSTDRPQLLVRGPQWLAQVWLVLTAVQPHMPDTPPPPHVWPVPEHEVGHCTVWPQLLTVGPQWPPAQVVAVGSSVQLAQSLPSARQALPVQLVVV